MPKDITAYNAAQSPAHKKICLALAKQIEEYWAARGGIVVDAEMRTSDPRIWAVGDAVEVRDVVTGQEVLVPLAGPANRQGRVAAESIAGRPRAFRGVQATAVVGCFGLVIASTGASERGLRRAGVEHFEKVYLHPGHHAGYYPGAKPIHLKLLFSVPDGRILGAQAVGEEGVDKRIDVMHAWVRRNASQLELPKAPYELQLFDEPSEEASAELQEWLDLVVDNQTDAVSAWHHCMRTWVGG